MTDVSPPPFSLKPTSCWAVETNQNLKAGSRCIYIPSAPWHVIRSQRRGSNTQATQLAPSLLPTTPLSTLCYRDRPECLAICPRNPHFHAEPHSWLVNREGVNRKYTSCDSTRFSLLCCMNKYSGTLDLDDTTQAYLLVVYQICGYCTWGVFTPKARCHYSCNVGRCVAFGLGCGRIAQWTRDCFPNSKAIRIQ